MGNPDAYTMSSSDVYRFFEPRDIEAVKEPYRPQRSLDDFGKASRTPFLSMNPRTLASCVRYLSAGVAGQECKMLLSQAQRYEQMTGQKILSVDSETLSIYSILPKLDMGMTERNLIFIKNWNTLNYDEKRVLSKYFDSRGVALPGMSSVFIKENVPNGRQEKRVFEAFNLIHGLDMEITPEGMVFASNLDDVDPDIKEKLKFYFTPDGYAKVYFQTGFMDKLGLKFREHTPPKIKTRKQLLEVYDVLKEREYTAKETEVLLLKRNPSLKTDIRKFDDDLATQVFNRYRLYTKMSDFINEDLMFIGTTSYADDIFDLTEEFENKSNVVSSTFYRRSKFGIAVSDPYAMNVKKMEWVLDNSDRYGWIPKNCNVLDYISIHGFAHGLIQVYDLSRDPTIRQIEENLMSNGGVAKAVSLNAKLNTKEFIADCWSEYCISKHPRETSKLVGDRILKFLQKKVILL